MSVVCFSTICELICENPFRRRTRRRLWGHVRGSESWKKRVHRPRRASMLKHRKDGRQRRGNGQKLRIQGTSTRILRRLAESNLESHHTEISLHNSFHFESESVSGTRPMAQTRMMKTRTAIMERWQNN